MLSNNKTNLSIRLSGEHFDHKGIEGGRKMGAEVWFFIETITSYTYFYNISERANNASTDIVFSELMEIIKKTVILTIIYVQESIFV